MNTFTLRLYLKATIFILITCGATAFAQSITPGTITGSPFCAGSNISVPFSSSGLSFYSDNTFSLQLSDASGSFNSATTIGSNRTQTTGTIVGTIPSTITSGTGYRIRVTSSNAGFTGSSSAAFAINGAPNAPTVTNPAAYCQFATANSLATNVTVPVGTTAYWVSGNTATFTTSEAFDGGGYTQASDNKRTNFTTSVANTTIISIDYFIPSYQGVAGLVLGLYDANDNLITLSGTNTNYANQPGVTKITNLFNYTLAAAGSYSIGIYSGGGTISSENFSGPVTQGSLTMTSAPSGRLFNNIKYTVTAASTTPPTVSTATTGTTTYGVMLRNASGCNSPVSNITVTVNALPTVSAISGTSAICVGSGTTFTNATSGGTWSSSNTAIATVNSSGIVTGVSVGAATINYSVTANTCTTTQTYPVNVYKVPTAYTVTGGGSYCSPGSGVAVGLSNSETGMSYRLMLDNAMVGSAVAGNGSAISFGIQAGIGNYTVVAVNSAGTSCTQTMNGSATISLSNAPSPLAALNALPLASNWFANNPYSNVSTDGGSGLFIANTGSELRFGYSQNYKSQTIWLSENASARSFAITAGRSYVVTVDFKNSGLSGNNLANSLVAAFGSQVMPTGSTSAKPTTVSNEPSSSALGSSAYVSLSFTITASSTISNAFLFFTLNLPGQPDGSPTFAIKNLKITPVTDAICSGSATAFTSGQNSGTYAWYTTETGGTAISGATGSTYTTPALTNTTLVPITYSYYVSAVGSCPSVRGRFDVVVNPVANLTTTQTSQACSGTAFTFVPSGVPVGTTYKWTAPVMSSGVTGGSAQTGQASSISQTLSGSVGGTATYTVTPLSGACQGTTFTLVVTLTNTTYIWKGTTSSVWTDASNWTCAGVPPANPVNQIIIQDVANKPVLSANTVVQDLTLQGNTTLTIGAYTLTINGALNGATNLVGSSASSLAIGGSGNMTLGFNQATTAARTLANYTQTRGATVTLANSLLINNTVTLTGNSNVLASAGNLTLLAPTATSNANIGPLTGTSAVTGDVNIQIWITGGATKYRSTRMLSSPINDAGTNKTFFQQLQNFMFITGPGNTANGFDLGGASQPNAVTMTMYNETKLPAVSAFDVVPSILTANKSSIAKGYFLFYRGNRTTNANAKLNATANVYAVPETQLMTFVGPINAANVSPISFPVTNSNISGDSYNGYNALGNPFPSAISWTKLQANNSTILSPNIVSIIMPDGLGLVTVSGGVVVNNLDNVNAMFIQPGQGFYVKANSSGNVVFNENIKDASIYNAGKLLDVEPNTAVANVAIKTKTSALATTNTISAVNNTVATGNELLRINLADDENMNETAVVFKDGNLATYGQGDAIFFSGNTVSVSTMTSDNYQMAINFMPKLDEVPNLKIAVNSTVSGNVKLNFTDLSAVATKAVYLKDNYLNKSVQITTAQSSYPFYIDKAVASSFGTERFVLDFEEPVSPVKLTSFTAVKNAASVALKWRPAAASTNTFELEHATDLAHFSVINTVQGNGSATYAYTDTKPVKGDNFYRLKESNPYGVSLYSEILTINFAEALATDNTKLFTIYPNPTARELNVNFKEDLPVQLTIYDLKGKPVLKDTFEAKQLIKENISTLLNGLYFVELTDLKTAKTIGVSKFYKL